jgi:hypothetical protein
METLVQRILDALKAPLDVKIVTRLDRIKKVQLKIK